MKFPISGGSDDALSATATRYAYLSSTNVIDWSTAESARQIPLSDPITITDFKVFLDVAPGVGKSRTFTVRKNGAASEISITISGTATTGAWSGLAAFAALDLISLESTPSGTPTAPGNVSWYSNIVTVGQTFLMMGGGDTNFSATVDNFCNPMGSTTNTTNATNQDIRIPSTFTVTKAAIASAAAPGVGKSWALSLRLNNTTDALTATISDAATSATASGSQALTTADAIIMKVHPSGTPTQSRLSWCYTIAPGTNGESFTGIGTPTALPISGATAFDQPVGMGAAMPATESAAVLRLPACSFKRLNVRLTTAPGLGQSRTTTLRDNNADTALTATISDTAVTAADNTHTVAHTADNTIDLGFTTSLAPAGSNGVHASFVIVTTQPTESSYGFIN